MTSQTKTVIKSYFETNDKPTQAQFADLIDSYQDANTILSTLTSSAAGIQVKSGLTMIARSVVASAASLLTVENGDGASGDINLSLPASLNLVSRTTLVAIATAASNDTTAASTAFVTTAKQVLQQVRTETGAVSTGTTQIPYDDSPPLNTEGDQYMTLAITPKSATSKLLIESVANFTNSNTVNMTMALFQDAIVSALAATPYSLQAGAFVATVPLKHQMTSGTTSATTFKIRIGGGGAGTTTFNGTGGTRLYGGVNASSIVITEYSS